ncbi:MAG: ParB/RepB/Spo0J family partition protein [Proteobacteria bacterium]|nr:ParB/RepB/Spo0J family partition protein [Pseudomonadota bacterium]MBU4356865.1 ParB/RepB/Spo0J family partition protein [Pseudomonadota bacterium]
MAEEIREVLNLLNEKLAGLFPYRLEMVTPGELKLLEKNARYMKAEQFQNLVENIKKDGNLSSLPLCYREKDGKLRVLSGNHRVQAGRQAGVEQVLVMVVGDEKDADERLAIQLSHNAIAGQDDLVILKNLWESIQNVQAKLYAGLDSETIKSLEGIQFAAIAEQRLNYKMANFVFLPEELENLDQLLKEIAVVFAADVVYLASLNIYDAFFELIVQIKKHCQIKNSAAAFLKLMELARIGLEKLKEEEALQDGEGPHQEACHGLA